MANGDPWQFFDSYGSEQEVGCLDFMDLINSNKEHNTAKSVCYVWHY